MNKFKRFILHVEDGIDSIAGSSLLIHAVMIGAAAASYGNIRHYLSSAHTNEMTAHAMAIVLGASLVISASRLTKLNLSRIRVDRSMQIVVLTAIATGVLSGVLQTSEYIANEYGWLSAASLGFGIPLLMEVGPALTVALLKNVDEAERTDKLRQNMADKISTAIGTALDGIRPDDIRGEIEDASKVFVSQFVDSTLGDMLHQLRATSQHQLSDMLSDNINDMSQPVKEISDMSDKVMTASDRRDKLFDMVPDGTPIDSIDYDKIGETFGVTGRTIYRDFEYLSKNNRWHVNGLVTKLEV